MTVWHSFLVWYLQRLSTKLRSNLLGDLLTLLTGHLLLNLVMNSLAAVPWNAYSHVGVHVVALLHGHDSLHGLLDGVAQPGGGVHALLVGQLHTRLAGHLLALLGGHLLALLGGALACTP